MINTIKNIALVVAIIFISGVALHAARIKDVASIEGFSGVQVIGYGLVTGLNNTGDNQQATFTVQSIVNILKRFGLTVPQTNPRVRNVAGVMITATIPAFMKKGSKVDVTVSSMGDATSLQGGVLIMSPLSISTGDIIGMAQGALSVGGYDFQSMGSRVSRNFVTAGRVPNGLILDKDITGQYIQNNILRLSLRDPDFTTSSRIATVINSSPGLANSANPLDAGTVSIQLPTGQTQQQIMNLIAQIEALPVESDPTARVIINERTGTVVIGGNVQLLPAVISHGGLEIQIQRQVVVAQPAPFTIRPPQPTETATITAQEEANPAIALTGAGPTVQNMAQALNTLKVKPRDLIAIFQALKEAGALQGELIIQ